jgi:tetratricopeptide (TPR) repeat protein
MSKPQADSKSAPALAAKPPAAATRAPWWLRLAFPVALALATLASFWPCLSQGFVELDDDYNFISNTLYRGLTGAPLAWMWSLDGFHIGHWHPLTWMSFGLDYELYGVDGVRFHRIGLLAHAASVVLLYFVALRLLRLLAARAHASCASASELALRSCSALAALSWGLHPLRVESVAWVTERRDVLSTLFLLLALLFYLRMVASPASWLRWLALSLLAFCASLLCKAWGMTFPLLLLVLDVLVLQRTRGETAPRVSWKRVLTEKLVFLPPAVFFAVQAARAQAQVAAILTWEEHGLWQRSAQAAYGLFWYPLKTLWPSELNCMVLLEPKLDPTQPVYLLAQAALVLALGFSVFAFRRWPALIGALLCYAILVSPVLGFLQSGSQKVADRYAHLAAIPFSLLAAAAVLRWTSAAQAAPKRNRRTALALGLSVLLSGLLGSLSNAQTRVWKDSETLFSHAVKVDPTNYFMLHNLATQYWKQARYAEAREMERRSVAAHPEIGNEPARYALGELSRLSGDLDGAVAAWRECLAIAPDHTASLRQLINVLVSRKDYAGAVAACEASLLRKPEFLDGWTMLVGLHTQSAQRPAVLDTWKRAAAVLPRSALVQNGYGKALQEAGRLVDAEACLVRAIELDNHNVEFAADAGALFLAMGRKAQAADLLRQVIAVAPNHPRARQLFEQATR